MAGSVDWILSSNFAGCGGIARPGFLRGRTPSAVVTFTVIIGTFTSAIGLSAIAHRLWGIGHRQSAIGYRPSAIGHRPSAIGYRLSPIDYRPSPIPLPVPSYQHFEDLPVWQEAARLYNQVLDLLEQHGALFSPGYRNQLDRASLSISNNIAEGFERVTTRELLAFSPSRVAPPERFAR